MIESPVVIVFHVYTNRGGEGQQQHTKVMIAIELIISLTSNEPKNYHLPNL